VLRCPVCRADNAGGPACRRCKADLSLLFSLEAQREQALAEAGRLAAAGDAAGLLAQARRADRLRSDGPSRRLLALAHLLRRDFPAALAAHRALS
jgi:hypothetical protein